MMYAMKTCGRIQADLAEDFAVKVGRSVTFDGSILRFDGQDAADLEEMAGVADAYWTSVRQPSRAKAACVLMGKFAEIRPTGGHAIRLAR